jgi:3-methylcrotonyl-CoA carboxylase alpha subunit
VAEITRLNDGEFLVTSEGKTQRAFAVRGRSATWVFLDGDVHVIDTAPTRTRRATGDDNAALAAPMPATVVSIAVAVGQQVASGDTLILLEAMKMELSIKAPRAGRVTRIACHQGELVQPGVPLVELAVEPA